MVKNAWKKDRVRCRVLLHKQQSHSVVEKPTPQIQILFYVHSINGTNCVSATGVATFFELVAPLPECRRECRLQGAISIECSTYISEIDTKNCCLSAVACERGATGRSLSIIVIICLGIIVIVWYIVSAIAFSSLARWWLAQFHSSFFFFLFTATFSIFIIAMISYVPCMLVHEHERAFCVHSHLVKLVCQMISPGKNARNRFLFSVLFTIQPECVRVCLCCVHCNTAQPLTLSIFQRQRAARIGVHHEMFHLLVHVIAISICLFTKYHVE